LYRRVRKVREAEEGFGRDKAQKSQSENGGWGTELVPQSTQITGKQKKVLAAIRRKNQQPEPVMRNLIFLTTN
jgi:hypothetical protein